MIPRRVKYVMLAVIFLATVSSCQQPAARQSGKQNNERLPFSSFMDVPGITGNEISAIEALQEKKTSFVYGMEASTEAFIGENGEIRGYAHLFSGWLSRFLGMPVVLKFYALDDLLSGLESGEIDFTGELARTPEYQETYFMTGPITRRSVKIFRIGGGEPLGDIIYSRPPRFAFLERSSLSADVAANAGYHFETILTENFSTAYSLLKSGAVDAFLDMDTAEFSFDEYGNVVSEDFFPFIFLPSCLSTKKTDLKPIISAVEKALDNHTIGYLTELYYEGHEQYLKHKLYTMLTEGERVYIQDVPIVPIAGEFSNYPLSFFDTHTTQWEGIYFDILAEISKLCSLTFIPVNDGKTITPVLINMLENGEVLVAPELFYIEKYKDRFLWSEIPVLEDNYALITKSDFRNIRTDDVFSLKAGVRKDSVYSELFKKMFPGHWDLKEYDTMEELWSALEQGEIEVLFASRRRLIIYTNFYEDTSYRINLVLDHSMYTSFGFNKDAYILKSIVDKALRIININNITNQWMYKSYDYQRKLVEAQRPLLAGLILFFIVLITVTVLLMRSQGAGKKLEELVRERTSELALQTSKLYAVFDSIPDIVICKDMDLKYTQCNKVMEEFIGVKEKDIIGKISPDVLGLPANITEQIQEVDRSSIKEGIKIVKEEKIPRQDGSTVVFETIRAPLVLNGDTIGLVAISRDITRRKVMEEETRAASQAKSAFLANMSHELRTPLNVVIGLTDLVLENDKLDKNTIDNLAKISNAGSTLLSIVNDILDISKIESGKLELTPVEYQISSLLSDVITLVITRLGEKPITFVLDISDDLPNSLYGDDLRVKQILNNLLSNAVKYTHKGTIKLSISCERKDKDNIWMKMSVNDTGIGIREKDIQKLFSDYNQVDTRTNRSIEGTGLGLAITKRLAEMMRGEITVESTYGEGSTFHANILQGFVNDKQIGRVVAENLRNFSYRDDKRLAGKKLVRQDLSFAKVLVVDDMQTNLDVAAGLLRKYKMQVDCISNGPDAIERIRNGDPVYNVVFMDHMMPGMDGVEAAEAIRSIGTEYARKIPIIALTANAIQGTDNMFLQHGFQAFISKPIDIIALDSIIKKWVQNGSINDEEKSDK